MAIMDKMLFSNPESFTLRIYNKTVRNISSVCTEIFVASSLQNKKCFKRCNPLKPSPIAGTYHHHSQILDGHHVPGFGQ